MYVRANALMGRANKDKIKGHYGVFSRHSARDNQAAIEPTRNTNSKSQVITCVSRGRMRCC